MILANGTRAKIRARFRRANGCLAISFAGASCRHRFAAGGTGKTSLRLLQFISLALGQSLCGQHVFRRCRVLLLTLKDNDTEIQWRIEAVLLHYGIDRSELKGWLFCKAVRRKSWW